MLSYVNLVYAANVYAFSLRTNKDSSMGEFDESIISVFNILFESILFRFYMFLFPFRVILLQLQVILFQEQIFERLRLGAKEKRFGANSGLKYEYLVQKYDAPAPYCLLLLLLPR